MLSMHDFKQYYISASIPKWDPVLSIWNGSDIIEYSWSEKNWMLVNETFGSRVGRIMNFEEIQRLIEVQMQGKIIEVLE
jgi:hypothetical protein